jgi:hypothetical protein
MSLTNEFLEQPEHGAACSTQYITIYEIYAFLQQVKHGLYRISLNFVESDIRASRNVERQAYEEGI